MKRVKKIMIISVIYFAISSLLIYFTNAKPKKNRYDSIIVLGVSPNPDNNINPFLELRLKKAIELFNQNYSDTIIVTGKAKYDGKSEAQVMADFLQRKGIPKESIIKEEKASCTEENIMFSKEILDSLNMHSSLIISSNHHTARIKLLCEKFDVNNGEVINGKNNFLSIISYIPLRIWEQTKFNRKYTPYNLTEKQ